MITFADIQIFTGIAILISGFSSLRCGLSSYHWQLIVQLAWFASITHLSALSFLRHYLHNRKTERTLRITLMLVLLILLSVAVWPTGHFEWDKWGASRPAVCAFCKGIDTRTTAFQSMIITIILLIYGYLIRIAKMIRKSANGMRAASFRWKCIAIRMSQDWNPGAEGAFSKQILEFFKPLVISFYRVIHIQVDLLTSFLAEVSSGREPTR